MSTSIETLTIGSTARLLGVSVSMVRKLDDQLAPARCPLTGQRRYSAARVAELAAERAQRRSAAR